MKLRFYFLITAFLLGILFPMESVHPLALHRPGPVIDSTLQTRLSSLAPQDQISVIVILNDQVNVRGIDGKDRNERRRNIIAALKSTSDRTQVSLRVILRRSIRNGDVSSFTPLWITNAIAVTGNQNAIDLLARQPEVKNIVLDQSISGPDMPTAESSASPVEPNLALINAPSLWDMGYQGQGIVIASMDTGVDYTHPDLSAQWRGGTNSWFDPYGQHPTTPTDLNGHGTWTMGVMVGRDMGGSSIGVAPQATWISVKIFNDNNSATVSAIHEGFQWLLDPDGDSQTDDAPDVVNNSWTFGAPGCDLSFEPDLQALVAAGILPVFAAGNYGPAGSTSASPANNPSAFAVGATNNSDVIYAYSSRGPNSCGQTEPVIYPAVVAPGVGIRTSDLYSSYYSASGTSLAAPHISGAIALLLNAFPALSVADLQTALTASSLDLGVAGPDDAYGNGRIDVLAAYDLVASGALATATPLPTNTVDPLLSDTPTPAPTITNTPTSLPSETNTPTSSPSATFTSTLTQTFTPSPTATLTSTPSSTATRTATPTTAPLADDIFADGFESGNLSAWSSSKADNGDLSVYSAAALAGTYGLQAVLDDNTVIYVTDDTPNAETRYRARFYFDPNSIPMANNDAHFIFYGYTGTSSQVVRVEFRFSNSNYQLRTAMRNDNSGWTSSSWFTISDASHFVELDWRAATASGANNGSLTLWIDGIQRANLTNVDNDTRRIDRVRLGAVASIDSGTRGTYHFDAYVSKRSSYIGP